MVNTRSKSEGTEAPEFIALPMPARASSGKGKKATSRADRRAEEEEWGQHTSMPGGFNTTPKPEGRDTPIPPPTDEIDERRVSEELTNLAGAGVASSSTAPQTPHAVRAGPMDMSPSGARAGPWDSSPTTECADHRGQSPQQTAERAPQGPYTIEEDHGGPEAEST